MMVGKNNHPLITTLSLVVQFCMLNTGDNWVRCQQFVTSFAPVMPAESTRSKHKKCFLNPLAPFGIGSQTHVPRAIFEGGGYMNSEPKLSSAILKIEDDFASVFYHISLNIGPI